MQFVTTGNYIAVEGKSLDFVSVYELACTELHGSGSFVKRMDSFCAIYRHDRVLQLDCHSICPHCIKTFTVRNIPKFKDRDKWSPTLFNQWEGAFVFIKTSPQWSTVCTGEYHCPINRTKVSAKLSSPTYPLVTLEHKSRLLTTVVSHFGLRSNGIMVRQAKGQEALRGVVKAVQVSEDTV